MASSPPSGRHAIELIWVVWPLRGRSSRPERTDQLIGLVTPPYGLLLFMMVKIADVPLKDLVRDVMPFLWVMIGALALMTYVPEIVLFLPKLMGYKG